MDMELILGKPDLEDEHKRSDSFTGVAQCFISKIMLRKVGQIRPQFEGSS